MHPDLALVLGSVIFLLAVPALISAFTDSRPPRLAAMFFVIGGGLIVFALQKGNGYTFAEIPAVFARVFGSYFR